MIGRDEALLALRDACPSFHAVEVSAYADDSYGYAGMAEVSSLARHLVDLAERGEADEFPSVFRIVEALLADGDDETVALVRTGLIEDIQNITSHRDIRVLPDDFRAVLGPEARDVWDELDESWLSAAVAPVGGPDRPAVEDYLDLDSVQRRKLQSMTRELPDGTLARPSDVLRYEAVQYDDALDRRALLLRRRAVALVSVLLLILAVGIIVAS